MSKPHRFATCGLSFTQHQWDFLRQIPERGNLALSTSKDQSLARSLAEVGAIHIDAGVRNDPEARKADPSLPIWRIAPTAELTDLGRTCVSSEPEDLMIAAGAAAAARKSLADAKADAKDTIVREQAQKLYGKILTRGMPLTMTMLPAYKQSIVHQCLGGLSMCYQESADVILLQIIYAWNWGIYHAIPKNRNPLFLELRAALPFVEDRAGLGDARKVIDELLDIIPGETSAYAHLLKAGAFLEEVEELLPARARLSRNRRHAGI